MKRLLGLLLIAGLVTAGVGYALGGDNDVYWEGGRLRVAKRETKTLLVTDQLAFTELDLRASVADVRVQVGDAFRIEAEYRDGQTPAYELAGGVLKVYDTGTRGNAFRFSVGVRIDGGNRVSVTLPRGTRLAKADVSVDVGSVLVDGVSADSATANASTGELRVRGAKLGKLSAQTGVGEVELSEIITDALSVRSGPGDVRVSGELRGDSEIRSDVGSIRIETSLGPDEYRSVVATADVGEVRMEPEWRPVDLASGHTIRAECGVGDVRIKFSK